MQLLAFELTKVTVGDANSFIFVCVATEMPLLGCGGGGGGGGGGGSFSLASIATLSFPEVEYFILLFPLLKPSWAIPFFLQVCLGVEMSADRGSNVTTPRLFSSTFIL